MKWVVEEVLPNLRLYLRVTPKGRGYGPIERATVYATFTEADALEAAILKMLAENTP